ncbi:4-alpha-glucanotransferase [Rhodococcus sp. X156]|uniref:4-alpha-glucanotransferase n=1 Tax=Rhodococcus sp. X156 TaxID=2499145 RepID=UPI000FDA7BAA|nr:4-alpha-glucanotransferase [Rhodococcus sp. X156]
MSSPEVSTDEWGISLTWLDDFDQEQHPSEQTLQALRTVIGTPPADLDQRAPLVLATGDAVTLPSGQLVCEDGTTLDVGGPAGELPLGYHRLVPAEGPERRLIVSPGRCFRPEPLREWGMAVQVYAARARGSWGTGDLASLRTVREWAQQRGAGFLLVNPLHGVAPTLPQEDSPYLPATRRFRNPLYLRIPEVPGADDVLTPADHAAAAELAALDTLDRDAAWTLQRAVLRRIFDAAQPQEFAQWRAEQGAPLQEWATWCLLAQQHGDDFHDWPEELHDPAGPAVAAAVAAQPDEVAFHAWLQWNLQLQLERACDGMTVLQDLPVGVSGGGADAWAWQGVMADGVTVGAPPDEFNGLGQDWGSPPFVPWRLRLADYEPFIQGVRATLAGAGGLRVDHVMGLFRLWWVPPGKGPTEGAYVRYPWQDMLNIVALESHRAQALVVGEDLGVVEDGVREAMADFGILSYRLLYFEEDAPATWPVEAMSAVTTHDLPTVCGLVDGTDMAEQQALVLGSDEELAAARAGMLAKLGVRPEMTGEQAVLQAHEKLAQAPSALLCATIDDAVLAVRRPNVPGTTTRDNWCIPLPVLVDDLGETASAEALAEELGSAVRPGGAA